MDSDLNIIWQRHCLEPVDYHRDFGKMIVLDDNSVAVFGINATPDGTGYLDHTEAFYLIVHDDYDELEEQSGIFRPYSSWPNPVTSKLHLQFSPDIQPVRIDLYDLQGHMVLSQNKGLESLNLQGLAAGQYLMKVSLDNGTVFTDKIIKE